MIVGTYAVYESGDDHYLLPYLKSVLQPKKWWQLLKIVALGLLVLLEWDLAYQDLYVCQARDNTT